MISYFGKVFSKIISKIITIVTYLHTEILGLNDSYELYLSDKELHFYVVAIFGFILLVVLFPLFNFLVKRKKTLYITWIYVFTFLLAFTLLIEVGQKLSGTGDMDYMDTVAGLVGFLLVSLIVFILRWLFMFIRFLFGGKSSD